jgi:hypothetical protein
MKSVLWILALAACSESSADSGSFAKPPPPGGLQVELAAVTLADDCAPPTPPPSTPAAPPKPSITKPADDIAPGAAPRKVAPGYRGNCDQTTMQLKISTPADFKAGSVKIKKVELLDADGKFLQTLSSRNPRAWKNTTSYLPWDEKIGPSVGTNAMYDLSAPDWNKLTNGRWNAHSKAFQVRVVVEIGGNNKTLTKSTVTPTRLPPPVPT